MEEKVVVMEGKMIVDVSRYGRLVVTEAKYWMLRDAYQTLRSYDFDNLLEVFFGKREDEKQ